MRISGHELPAGCSWIAVSRKKRSRAKDFMHVHRLPGLNFYGHSWMGKFTSLVARDSPRSWQSNTFCGVSIWLWYWRLAAGKSFAEAPVAGRGPNSLPLVVHFFDLWGFGSWPAHDTCSIDGNHMQFEGNCSWITPGIPRHPLPLSQLPINSMNIRMACCNRCCWTAWRFRNILHRRIDHERNMEACSGVGARAWFSEGERLSMRRANGWNGFRWSHLWGELFMESGSWGWEEMSFPYRPLKFQYVALWMEMGSARQLERCLFRRMSRHRHGKSNPPGHSAIGWGGNPGRCSDLDDVESSAHASPGPTRAASAKALLPGTRPHALTIITIRNHVDISPQLARLVMETIMTKVLLLPYTSSAKTMAPPAADALDRGNPCCTRYMYDVQEAS